MVVGLARISKRNDDLAYNLGISTSSLFPIPVSWEPQAGYRFILSLLPTNLKRHQEHSVLESLHELSATRTQHKQIRVRSEFGWFWAGTWACVVIYEQPQSCSSFQQNLPFCAISFCQFSIAECSYQPQAALASTTITSLTTDKMLHLFISTYHFWNCQCWIRQAQTPPISNRWVCSGIDGTGDSSLLP